MSTSAISSAMRFCCRIPGSSCELMAGDFTSASCPTHYVGHSTTQPPRSSGPRRTDWKTYRLSHYYGFRKPNDSRALTLMNTAATQVVQALSDITIAYGLSDEFSFVFHKHTTLFERRRDKLVSTVVSAFTAAYVHGWDTSFGAGSTAECSTEPKPDKPARLSIDMLPTFDGRAVCYPSWENLRDYLKWRQVDCWFLIRRCWTTSSSWLT
jgi:tRNA(His) 5'-end guanylyltransferase